jgi:hypothetical protein
LLDVHGTALVDKARVAGDDEELPRAREGRGDVLDHPVGKVLLLRVAGYVGEGQNRDRGAFCQRVNWRFNCGGGRNLPIARRIDYDAKHTHRLGNVLHRLVAHVFELQRKPVSDLVAHCLRHADASGGGERLQPRSDVDAVAVDAIGIGQHIAEVDADAVAHAPRFGQARVGFFHCTLDVDRALHCAHNGGKFGQHRISGRVDDAPASGFDVDCDQRPAFGQRPHRRLVILLHQSAVANHIGCDDRCKPAFAV